MFRLPVKICLCAVIYLIYLANNAKGLNLEGLISDVKLLKENYEIMAAKITHLEDLELKVKQLEAALIQQQETAINNQPSAAINLHEASLNKQFATQRNSIFRTCRELSQGDPSLTSGMYWIDPDGQGVGDDPIYVHCNMSSGTTAVLHDSEDPINVGHCVDPGCYSRTINYSASIRQMNALSELSQECHQSIRYDCNYAPLETNGVAQGWWNDKDGIPQYFWSGSNNSVHTCQCGIDNNCVEPFYLCNCDSIVPLPLNDSGVITDKKYLPITRLNFGRTQLETSSGVHTLGRLECSGQVTVSGIPKSCNDLWKIGYSLSGIYSIMGNEQIETVYCDFTKLPTEQGFQTWIGYVDVKSSPVYFYVQKTTSQSTVGRVSYEVARVNKGGAMDIASGIFTAPRNGIYTFSFACLGYYPPSTTRGALRIALLLNGNEVGRLATNVQEQYHAHEALSLHSTLELKTGDQISMSIVSAENGAILYDTWEHYTHFKGHLLQENLPAITALEN